MASPFGRFGPGTKAGTNHSQFRRKYHSRLVGSTFAVKDKKEQEEEFVTIASRCQQERDGKRWTGLVKECNVCLSLSVLLVAKIRRIRSVWMKKAFRGSITTTKTRKRYYLLGCFVYFIFRRDGLCCCLWVALGIDSLYRVRGVHSIGDRIQCSLEGGEWSFSYCWCLGRKAKVISRQKTPEGAWMMMGFLDSTTIKLDWTENKTSRKFQICQTSQLASRVGRRRRITRATTRHSLSKKSRGLDHAMHAGMTLTSFHPWLLCPRRNAWLGGCCRYSLLFNSNCQHRTSHRRQYGLLLESNDYASCISRGMVHSRDSFTHAPAISCI